MVEEYFGPLAQWVSSLIEVLSLMKSTRPLDQVCFLAVSTILVLDCFVLLHLLCCKVCIIELLFPAFHVATIEKRDEQIAENTYTACLL